MQTQRLRKMDFLTGKMQWRKRKHFKSTNGLIRIWKKQRFLSDLKRILRVFQRVKFFDNWHMDRLFLSLAIRKKISNFYRYINLIRIKNETCEFLQNLCTDFLVAPSVELLGC